MQDMILLHQSVHHAISLCYVHSGWDPTTVVQRWTARFPCCLSTVLNSHFAGEADHIGELCRLKNTSRAQESLLIAFRHSIIFDQARRLKQDVTVFNFRIRSIMIQKYNIYIYIYIYMSGGFYL